MGALKVNNVEIVNSTANVQSATLPTVAGVLVLMVLELMEQQLHLTQKDCQQLQLIMH